MSATLDAEPPVTDWPLYWFAALEKAVGAGNFEAAARAVRELRRLGVDVTYRRGLAAQKGGELCRA
jgi:hypothetical protein